jgi:hypothetical protein
VNNEQWKIQISFSARGLWLEGVTCIFNFSLFIFHLFSDAKLQHSHCGSRIFWQLFSIFFSKCYICCSVAVLQFSRTISHTQKILLYLYINIEFNFYFYIIYFGTATLQHCNGLFVTYCYWVSWCFEWNASHSDSISKNGKISQKMTVSPLIFMSKIMVVFYKNMRDLGWKIRKIWVKCLNLAWICLINAVLGYTNYPWINRKLS